MSVRFEERQKFKCASHNMRLTLPVELKCGDAQCVKRVGHAWIPAAPAHSQQLNRPWQSPVISFIVSPHYAAAEANNVTDAQW